MWTVIERICGTLALSLLCFHCVQSSHLPHPCPLVCTQALRSLGLQGQSLGVGEGLV